MKRGRGRGAGSAGWEFVPPVTPEEAGIVCSALDEAGGKIGLEPHGFRSVWRRAGLVESTGTWPPAERYARSPRRIRGATRA